MSDEALSEAVPTMPPRMEQWIDNLTNANMRLVNITSELHGFCDRISGGRPEPGPATGSDNIVKRLESSGQMYGVQERVDSLGESLAAAEGAISRLNSLGL